MHSVAKLTAAAIFAMSASTAIAAADPEAHQRCTTLTADEETSHSFFDAGKRWQVSIGDETFVMSQIVFVKFADFSYGFTEEFEGLKTASIQRDVLLHSAFAVRENDEITLVVPGRDEDNTALCKYVPLADAVTVIKMETSHLP